MGTKISNERRLTGGLLESGGAGVILEELDATFRKKRRFRRERTGHFVFGSQLARLVLARFDVGLVKCVDANNRAGHGCRNLPAKELLTKLVDVWNRDAHNWMAGAFEGRH